MCWFYLLYQQQAKKGIFMGVQAEQFPINRKIFNILEINILVVAAEYFQVDIEIYARLESKSVIRTLKMLQQFCPITIHEEPNSDCVRFKIAKYKDRQKLYDFVSLLYSNHLYIIGSRCKIITEITNNNEVETDLLYNNKDKLYEIIDNYIQELKTIGKNKS